MNANKNLLFVNLFFYFIILFLLYSDKDSYANVVIYFVLNKIADVLFEIN